MIRDTSLLAWADAKRGISESQNMVLSAIKQIGRPATMREIAEYLNIPINRVTPRIGELRAIRIVRECDKITDPATGRPAYTYAADGAETVRANIDILPCPIDSRISNYNCIFGENGV